jgi:uncharacterized protein YodC (DUF2158 family)
MESVMMLAKQAAIAMAVTLGIALSASTTTIAFADPALPDAATQNDSTFQFHNGDLVHLRVGSPMMMITSIEGDQANCIWTDLNGQLQSGRFPIALFMAPITLPSDTE